MAATIQNSSLYLSDDFLQALGNAQPAQLSKFQLIKLPTWTETATAGSMNVDASRLGLPSSTVNPNILFPAVLEQYWQNLSAYARKQHATVDDGKVIENFTEQAFWKCLATLLSVEPLDLQASMLVAECTNVITNINTTDGNASMETLLAVPAGTTQQAFSWKASKPTYLSVIKLPEQSTDVTIVGSKTAMYDNGLTYYNLLQSQCIRSVAGDAMPNECQYNAVLLYYSDGDVEQLAGIYFPSKFAHVSDDTWSLPTVSIGNDVTIGYTINIMFCNGNDISYVASNANANLAMQAYNNMYTKLANANLEISKLSNRVAAMQLSIDNLMRILNNGVLANMQNSIEDFKAKLATHFDGSVSTDQLLQLFLQAKQNTGSLNLSMNMSDMSKAVLGSEIVVHGQNVGQYKSGDVLEVGTSITDILRKMLDSRSGDPYIQPFASCLKDGVNYMLVLPGSTRTVHVDCHISQGDAGDLLQRYLFTFEGNTTIHTVQMMSIADITEVMSITDTAASGMKLFTLQQLYRYDNGPEHTYSDGSVIDGQILAGSIVSNFYVVPFEHVAIVFANATITTDNIIDRINNGDLTLDFTDSNELAKYNQVTNDVAFIIEMPAISSDDATTDAFADIGVYDEANSVDTRLDIEQTGNKLPARITRIANWDGLLNTEYVRPAAIFD